MREYDPRLTEQYDLRLLEAIFDFLDVEIEKETALPSVGVDIHIGASSVVTNFYYSQIFFGIGFDRPFANSDSLRPKRIVIELDDGHYELLKEI